MDKEKDLSEEEKQEENKKEVFSFKDGISIDEAKVSVLVLLTLVVVPFCLVMYYMRGDFTDNLKELAQVLIFCIAGVNGVSTLADIFNKVKEKGEKR